MITKITNGSRPGDIAAYLHGPGRQQEHVYERRMGGAVIGGTLGRNGARDGKGWAVDMREAAASRPDITKPIWHMSLRNAPGDPLLSDLQWADIAHQMGTEMGWVDKPWVVVRHGDDHVHIVVSRVGDDGSVWSRRDDRYKARRAAVQLERKYDLTPTPVRTREATQRTVDHQTTQGEHRKGARTGQPPERVLLAEQVRAARQAARGLGRARFEELLTEAGVQFRVNVAKTGTVSGYSFHQFGHRDAQGQEVWWKASQLDKALSWSRLSVELEQPLPVPRVDVPKKLLESAARHEQRVQSTQAQAQQVMAEKARQAMPSMIDRKHEQAGVWWAERAQRDRARTKAGHDFLERQAKSLESAREALRFSRQFTAGAGPSRPTQPGTRGMTPTERGLRGLPLPDEHGRER